MKYIIGIDQSTQGTKAMVFDSECRMLCRYDVSHKQIILENGWVEHNPEEIYRNVIQAVKNAVEKSGIDKNEIIGIGISNQRETTLAWTKDGKPVCNAVVWQCARSADLCREVERKRVGEKTAGEYIRETTGIPVSPYFPAGKIAWILQNVKGAKEKADAGELYYGTMDTFLVYRLTHGTDYRTDYSNASRTQLFNIHRLSWDEELCRLYGVPIKNLPEVTDSNGSFGITDLEGWLEKPVPIHAVLGDSQGALYGQGCMKPGMLKATYGTGSSVMMNIGSKPILSNRGLISSIAWGINGKINYVLEGNINYSGAVITWLKDGLHLIDSPKETNELAEKANPEDCCYLVPAFSGLGSPYWDSEARAQLTNMSRITGKNEIVRAALNCIAYQIADIVEAMKKDTGIMIQEIRADGGPAKNPYLMNFESGILGIPVKTSEAEELSGIGAAFLSGEALGLYAENSADLIHHFEYRMIMDERTRKGLKEGWSRAVKSVLRYGKD